MISRRSASLVLSLTLLFSLTLAQPSRAADKIVLDHATVVADSQQPSFVQYAVEDLVGYLQETTGNKIAVAASPRDASGPCILVGPSATKAVLSDDLPNGNSGDEAYRLQALSKDGVDYVVATGATPRGTHAALMQLMKAVQVENKSAFVASALNMSGKPALAKRGMHFNGWAFNSPYSFRNWREEDWQRYLDILAYQGVNLFYVWPFIEIMPVPLSPEDQAYLEECRRIVDYAQKKHGMEVWIMQCTNRVARDRCGVADPRRRPYWRPSQEDLNPGNPDHFKAIMASREAMYRILNNVDGVCNIDSDPGYCPGSPLSDYAKVLKGCRELLDRHNLHGKQTKLVNWMWTGWGRRPQDKESPDAFQMRTIQTLKTELPEPWSLVAGNGSMLSLCRRQDVVEKTVLLPYGVIEGEPSYPATNLRIDDIRDTFSRYAAKYPQLQGMMGNVQTPLLQFPHMYYFTSAMFDADYRGRPEKDILLDVCGHLYPEHRQLLADCCLAINEADPAKIQSLADQLDRLIREDKLGRPGIFARKLFPDHRIVAQTILLQLNLRAAEQRLSLALPPATAKADCEKLLCDYLSSYLAWDTAHGWHNLWSWREWPLNAPPAGVAALAKNLGNHAEVDRCFERVAKTLSAKYDKHTVEIDCVASMKHAVLASIPIASLAQTAEATASVTPNPAKYPAGAAIDGSLATLYWPGALVTNNAEWLQLTWKEPQSFDKILVRFLPHRSMIGRTIHLQEEVEPGKWKDFATATITSAAAPYAVATFRLPHRKTLNKLRIVNLLDLFEVEVY